MKCEVCLQRLEEYIDSELAGHEAETVSAHLITCVSCASEFYGLTAEEEVYARYDRGLEIAPSMWSSISARTAESAAESGARYGLRDRIATLFTAPSLSWSFAGAVAVLLMAAVVGIAYLGLRGQTRRPDVTVKMNKDTRAAPPATAELANDSSLKPSTTRRLGLNHDKVKSLVKALPKSKLSFPDASANQSDVLFSDVAYSTVEEQETQKHIEQAQNLLRSVRNIECSDDDVEIDISYEKALARQLLNENVVLRRDAEMNGEFPVKTLLSSLEPFLLDIANLPERAAPDELRVIKDRVQKTEIVASLHSY